MTIETFQPVAGTSFQIIINEQPVLNLELAEVEDLSRPEPRRQHPEGYIPFSLIFHGPLQPIAAQQIYDLQNDQLGRVQIFLVPIGPDKQTGQKMQYQAIFN